MEKFKPIIFYIIFFLFILTYSSLVNGYDYDLWAKLILGMAFVQTGQVLKQDFLSYTPTHTWYDHEWGSGVIFYLTQHFFSTTGLLLLQATLVFLIFFTVTKIIKLRGVKTTSPYNFLFYIIAFLAVNINFHSQIRSQMFSFLLFAVFLYILELARQGKNKPLWLLPFIMIFWNNLHGGCVSGVGLIVLYIIGEFFNRASVKKYILTLIPTVLVLVINPWGLSYLGFLASATTRQRPEIMEWLGIFSKHYQHNFTAFKTFALTLLLSKGILVAKSIINKSFSLKKIDKTKFLVLTTTLFMAIQHVKMVPFFVISASCFLYDDFYICLNSFVEKLRQKLKLKPNFIEGLNRRKEFAVYVAVITFILFNLRAKSFEPLLGKIKYPLMEVEFVKINDMKGNLFVNFGVGSYASYKLYPNNLIFIDGRYEAVYNDDLFDMMGNFLFVDKGWDALLKKFPPDIIIMDNTYPIYNQLQKLKNWKLAYKGKYFGVFIKSENVKKSYKTPSNSLKYYQKTLFDTNIFFKK